jgi:hypothetical protein
MPELSFIESAKELGIELSENEGKIIVDEMVVMQEGMAVTKNVFQLKLSNLIKALETRAMTNEQVINVLLDDLENDGVIFGGLKRQLIGNAQEFVETTESRLTMEQFEKESGEEKGTWIAVLVNTCKDCLPRHGFTKTFSKWEELGMPKSGFSVCKSKCQCQVFPASVIEENKTELRSPLKRVKGKITQIAKEKNVKSVKRYVNRKLGSINDTKDPIRKEYRKLLPGFKR